MIAAPAVVTETVTRHIAEFVEQPHPSLGHQPICPFARKARKTGRVRIAVTPFALADDSAVAQAVADFESADQDVLLVVHPDPAGVTFAELDGLRERFEAQLSGRYDVFTGHPDDPHEVAGVRTRHEPHPMLHFIRCETLAAAERRIGPRRRLLTGRQPGA